MRNTEAADTAVNLASPEHWDAAFCQPSSGSGTLAKWGRVLLLAQSDDPAAVAPLLAQAAMVAANGGEGRQLVRGYALLLGTSADELPPFIALAPHATGLAVLAVGEAEVEVNGEVISGRDSLAWVEKLVPWPIHSLIGRVDPDAEPAPGWMLGEGVIGAGGFVLTGVNPAGSPVAVPAEPASPPSAPPPPPTPPPAPAPPPAAMSWPEPPDAAATILPPTDDAPRAIPPTSDRPQPPALEDKFGAFDSVLLGESDAGLGDVAPLPIVEGAGDLTDSGQAEQVSGVMCPSGHFNDPRELFCTGCGTNLVQEAPDMVDRARPPLGVLVLDDGAVFQLDSPYLLGRDPGSDERVRSGSMRGVPVVDQSNQISRVHARLELRGWDVVLIDNHSTNGTYISPPSGAGWQRLAPGGEYVLTQGTRVRIGHRTLAFSTHGA